MLIITHPERIIYPETGITKRDLAQYYEAVEEWMLPYVKQRALTLLRCPQGQAQKCFYQKHLHDKIDGLYPIEVQDKNSVEEYSYLKSVDGLVALVQFGVLEIHCWGSKIDKLEQPDVIIFDLDPAEDVSWKNVMGGAKIVRQKLTELKLVSFVKTTGGKGLHVVVPIKRKHDFAAVKQYSHDIVDELVAEYPQAFTGTITKSKRVGKIFLDYLRNQHGATAIAPYSTRVHAHAPVATPIHWDELNARLKPASFTVKTLPKRLKALKDDPWEDYFKVSQKIKI